jgi:hypothetical protein
MAVTPLGHDGCMSSTIDLDIGAESVVDVVSGLCAPVAGWDARKLGERLVELERLRRRVEAATLAVLDEAEHSGGFRDDGHVTVGGWVRATVNWSFRETTDRVRAVQLTRLCPSVASELAEGRVGVAQVCELGRARANPRVGDQIADCIDEMLEFAQELDLDGFRKVCGIGSSSPMSMARIAVMRPPIRVGGRACRGSMIRFI